MLSDSKLNTARANPGTDRIGVMPNLQAIISRPWYSRIYYYLAWAWMILIGGLLIILMQINDSLRFRSFY